MRLRLEQLALMNLAQTMPEDMMGFMPRERAYEWLKRMTGQDFGYDVAAWKQWFKENRRKKNKKK